MGKSRKQKLKTQDFQKKKLKVGKTAAKPTNATDTSFTARTINIRNQHLTHDPDLKKRLPLLKHHNNVVRKETLQIFKKQLPQIVNSELMTPLLLKIIPLVVDESRSVREAFVELIDAIGESNKQILKLHCQMFVLYLNMSMTHIVSAISADSTKLLKVLLKYCGDELCRQWWEKLLQGLLNVLGWSGPECKNLNAGSVQTKKRDAKAINIHLQALHDFIVCGCTDIVEQTVLAAEPEIDLEGASLHIPSDYSQFLMPNYPQPYQHLKLFTKSLKDNSSSQSERSKTTSELASQDFVARLKIFQPQYQNIVSKNLDILIKEGGECGKTANNLKQLLSTL